MKQATTLYSVPAMDGTLHMLTLPSGDRLQVAHIPDAGGWYVAPKSIHRMDTKPKYETKSRRNIKYAESKWDPDAEAVHQHGVAKHHLEIADGSEKRGVRGTSIFASIPFILDQWHFRGRYLGEGASSDPKLANLYSHLDALHKEPSPQSAEASALPISRDANDHALTTSFQPMHLKPRFSVAQRKGKKVTIQPEAPTRSNPLVPVIEPAPSAYQSFMSPAAFEREASSIEAEYRAHCQSRGSAQ